MKKQRVKQTLPHEYVFKACWHSTAVSIKVLGKSYDDALERAERTVFRMEGGVHCEEIKFVKQIH